MKDLLRSRAWLGCLLALCAAAASADVRLQLDGAPRELADNIRAHLGQMPEDAAGTGRAYERRLREQAEEAARALGYYHTRIQISRERDGDDTVLRLLVTPGARVQVSEVQVNFSGEAADDQAFAELRERLPVRPGMPLNHGDYESAKRMLQNLALRRGYFDARYRRHRVEVDLVSNTARVLLDFDSGRRYAIGQVRFIGETPFAASLLDGLVPFETPVPYEAALIADLNRALLDSRYFASVQVRPQPDQAEDGQLPVDVYLRAEEPNRVGVGLGYSTDVGVRGRLNWTKPYVNRWGDSFKFDMEASQVRWNAAAQYQIPLTNPRDDFLQFQLGYQDEEVEDTDSQLFTAAVQRQRLLASGWRRTVSLSWQRERFVQGSDRGETDLLLPGISYTRTRVEGGIDPGWGDRQLLSLEAAHDDFVSDVSLVRVRLGTRWLRSFGEHRVFLRADLGAVQTGEFQEVPPSLRFFAGGDQSVRGYGYNTLAPRDASGDYVGGSYLLTGTAEYSYPLRPKWRLATFVDAGNAFDDLDAYDPRIGVGFGVHWSSPVGPIRLDLAWGVSESDTPFQLHFSLGPRL